MTSPAFEPSHFRQVATILTRDVGSVVKADWEAVEQARLRAAASRAYYSVFLEIKRLICESGYLEGDFPTKDAHSAVLRALRDALHPGTPLPLGLSSLYDEREFADYELHGEFHLDDAESLCDDASRLLRIAGTLSDTKLKDISHRLDHPQRRSGR